MPRQTVDGPWVWFGREQARIRDWIWEFTAAELAELSQAGEHARGVDLDHVTVEKFPLPTLACRLAALERELAAEGAG